MFCRQQVAELARHAVEFERKKARLVVIGSGDPSHFKAFKHLTGYHGDLFADPARNAFSFLGFSSSVSGFMSVRAVLNAVSALKNGHRQGAIQGSPLQLGGAVAIDTSDTVCYFFAGKKAGDHPDVADLLAAVSD